MRKFKENFKIALDMKWKGFRYREIAERLGVSPDTVKSWFRKNGLLQLHYEDYVTDQFILRRQEKEKETQEKHQGNSQETGLNGKIRE